MGANPDLPLPLFLPAIAVRTAIVLVALVAGIRVFGRRDVGNLNLLDLALVLLLGNAIQNAITTGSGQLAVGLVSAGTLLLLDRFSGILIARQPWLERSLFGDPVVVVSHGRPDGRAMRREGVTEDDIMAAARDLGLQDMSEIRLAVLEDDGSISVIPEEKARAD